MKRFKIGDIIVTLLLLGLAIYLLLTLNIKKSNRIKIEIDSPYSKRYYTFSKNSRTLFIKGKRGISKIVIATNYVKMVDSACPHKLCVKQGKISKPGQSIICLPNQVIIKLVAEPHKDAGVDAICH